MDNKVSGPGAAMKLRRKALGWSQQTLADRSGMSIDWIRSVESGRTANPRVESIAIAAEALGLSLSDMVNGVVTLREEGDSEYVSPERVETLNASFRTLQKLSPQKLRAALAFLETYARMSDDEFQNPRREPD